MTEIVPEDIRARNWWLVFESDSSMLRPDGFTNRRAVRFWTHPEFRHVWAIDRARCGAGIVTVQSLGMMLSVDWQPIPLDEALYACEAQGHRVVQVAGSTNQCYFPPMWAHCVTTTKTLVGIRAPLVCTPRQLWHYIHDRGLVL